VLHFSLTLSQDDTLGSHIFAAALQAGAMTLGTLLAGAAVNAFLGSLRLVAGMNHLSKLHASNFPVPDSLHSAVWNMV
jgi:hypothetical protein